MMSLLHLNVGIKLDPLGSLGLVKVKLINKTVVVNDEIIGVIFVLKFFIIIVISIGNGV